MGAIYRPTALPVGALSEISLDSRIRAIYQLDVDLVSFY
jgi:hypothetical protein